MPKPAVTILLVEDDDIDIEAVQRAFEKVQLGQEITVAGDGYEALNILRGEGGYAPLPSPYIIVLDIQLPRMNGIEFLQALRRDAKLKASVVFVLTTSDNQEDMMAAYSQQVAGYFLKKNAGQEFFILPALMKSYCQIVELPHP